MALCQHIGARLGYHIRYIPPRMLIREQELVGALLGAAREASQPKFFIGCGRLEERGNLRHVPILGDEGVLPRSHCPVQGRSRRLSAQRCQRRRAATASWGLHGVGIDTVRVERQAAGVNGHMGIGIAECLIDLVEIKRGYFGAQLGEGAAENAADLETKMPNFEIKVRGTMHLWGSAGITKNITFANPLLLHIHNDLFGEIIIIGTQTASGTKETIGTLNPGEIVTISINEISGVFASCEQESIVRCLIQ